MAVCVCTPVRLWNSCDGRTTDTGMYRQRNERSVYYIATTTSCTRVECVNEDGYACGGPSRHDEGDQGLSMVVTNP